MKAWEEVAGSGDTGLVTTSNNGRTPFVPDEYGNATVFGTTDNLQPTFPLDSRIVEFVQYGVLNGAFARGPAMPDANIEDINALPDWTGPTQVSGGAITARWVTANTPSGYAVQLTLNPGAASDEAYFEQIIPVGGDFPYPPAHTIRAELLASGGGVAASFTIESQYLDVNGATLGSATNTNSGTLAAFISESVVSQIGSASALTHSLRVRLHFLRDAAAATDSMTLLLGAVRLERNLGVPTLIAETSTLAVPSASPTPPTGFHAIYAKSTDSKLYSKSDAGTEYKLNNVIGTDVQAWDADLDTIASTYVGATAWTPALSYATVGTSTWAPSVQDGSYMRIGPLVWVWFRYVGVPTNGTGAGALTLSGLPVVAKTNTNSPWTLNGYMGGWTKATYTAVAVQVTSAAQTALFAAYGSGVAPANLAVADIPTGGSVTMKFEGFYETA